MILLMLALTAHAQRTLDGFEEMNKWTGGRGSIMGDIALKATREEKQADRAYGLTRMKRCLWLNKDVSKMNKAECFRFVMRKSRQFLPLNIVSCDQEEVFASALVYCAYKDTVPEPTYEEMEVARIREDLFWERLRDKEAHRQETKARE